MCQVVADKPESLVYLANQACIELHVFLSALGAPDQPGQLVFDLDPRMRISSAKPAATPSACASCWKASWA